MPPRIRSARVNTGLVVAFGLMVVIVGFYWIARSPQEELVLGSPDNAEIEYVLRCLECDYAETVSRSALEGLPRAGGMYVCPGCGKNKGIKTRVGSPSLANP